jgi:membrane associated rhomboid family serine protease
MSNFRFTRPEAFPPIIKNLIIINVLVWLAQIMYDGQFNLTDKLGLWPVESPHFKPYQVVTHMFAHSPSMIFHIFFNMFTLWMFGRMLENIWGAKRFLFFYLACGIGSAISHMTVEYFQYHDVIVYTDSLKAVGLITEAENILATPVYAVGASGAVMGVMAAFAFLFPNTELFIMFIPVPVKAKWAILGLVALDLFGGVGRFSGDSIAHFAHLGGALTGFIIVLIWNKKNRKSLY